MSILVYVENTDGKFKKSAFEVVSYAKSIADNIQTDLVAISIGNVAGDELAGLGKYGASKVLNVDNERLASFVNQAYASIIAEAVKSTGSKILVLSNSFSGKGLAPRIAAKLEAGLADGALELPKINGDKLTVKKTAFSNKAFATLELSSDIKVIALSPNAYETKETGGSATVETFAPNIDQTDFTTMVKEIVRATDKVSLPEAEIVVSAGRGLKGPETGVWWKNLQKSLVQLQHVQNPYLMQAGARIRST